MLLKSETSDSVVFKFLDDIRFFEGLLGIVAVTAGVEDGGGMGFAKVCLRVLKAAFFFFLAFAVVSSSVSSLLYLRFKEFRDVKSMYYNFLYKYFV